MLKSLVYWSSKATFSFTGITFSFTDLNKEYNEGLSLSFYNWTKSSLLKRGDLVFNFKDLICGYA
jgi:hypothetical protein